MKSQTHVILLVVGMILAVMIPIVTFANRCRVYAAWAKTASILVCIVGVAWGFLGLGLLYLNSSMSRQAYFTLGRVKTLLGGICVGVLLAFLIARPYQKVKHEVPEKT